MGEGSMSPSVGTTGASTLPSLKDGPETYSAAERTLNQAQLAQASTWRTRFTVHTSSLRVSHGYLSKIDAELDLPNPSWALLKREAGKTWLLARRFCVVGKSAVSN